jgi:hypothetical protein
MKKILLLIVLFVCLTPLYSQVSYLEDENDEDLTESELSSRRYWEEQRGTRYGIRDNNNKEILPMIYDRIVPIDSTMALLSFDGKHGIQKFDGENVIPFIYDILNYVEKDYIIAQKDGLWGVIDINNNVVLPIRYGGVCPVSFSKTLFWVKESKKKNSPKKGKWGIVDIKGKKKKSFKYDNMKGSNEACSVFIKNKKRGLTDSVGNEIASAQYDEFKLYKDFVIARKDSLHGVLDYEGKILLPIEYSKIKKGRGKDSTKIVFTACKDGLYGLVDINNKTLIPFKYYSMGYFNDGVSDVGTERYKYAIINEKGELITPFNFNFIYTFYDGIAVTDKGYKKYGVIDTEGNEVIPFIYEVTTVVSGHKDLILAKQNGKYGAVNRRNEVEVPFEFDYIYYFDQKTETSVARLDKRRGLIDKSGNIILPFEFDAILTYFDNVHVVGIKDNLQKIDIEELSD